jgi:hypothetical protein
MSQMGGGKDFKIFDSGSRDKMLLRLQLAKDVEYTIREHADKHISRGIGLGKVRAPLAAKKQNPSASLSLNISRISDDEASPS